MDLPVVLLDTSGALGLLTITLRMCSSCFHCGFTCALGLLKITVGVCFSSVHGVLPWCEWILWSSFRISQVPCVFSTMELLSLWRVLIHMIFHLTTACVLMKCNSFFRFRNSLVAVSGSCYYRFHSWNFSGSWFLFYRLQIPFCFGILIQPVPVFFYN